MRFWVLPHGTMYQRVCLLLCKICLLRQSGATGLLVLGSSRAACWSVGWPYCVLHKQQYPCRCTCLPGMPLHSLFPSAAAVVVWLRPVVARAVRVLRLLLLLVAGSTAVQNCSTSNSMRCFAIKLTDSRSCPTVIVQKLVPRLPCELRGAQALVMAKCRCLASLALLAGCGSCVITLLCCLNVLHVARAAWCCWGSLLDGPCVH